MYDKVNFFFKHKSLHFYAIANHQHTLYLTCHVSIVSTLTYNLK